MTSSFQLQGHRGARGLFPENTIEGFQAGIALGLRWFELDVGVLRDGTVVVHHDLALNPDIARTPGNNWFTGSGRCCAAWIGRKPRTTTWAASGPAPLTP